MLPFIHRQALRANRRFNIVYLNNPKVGCSTVKDNLWRYLSPETHHKHVDVHDIPASPFSDGLAGQGWLKDARVFTFVRNPFTRLVSAYLNKIKGREQDIWGWFARTHGLDLEAELSFDAFVEIIASDPPERLDPHWRPQHINIMYPFIEPNFLGRLETMDRDLPRVLSTFFGSEITEAPRKNVHRTDAAGQTSAFFADAATLTRTCDLFEKDFAYFGYQPDPSAQVELSAEPVVAHEAHPGFDFLQRLRLRQLPDAQGAMLLKTAQAWHATQTDRFTKDWLLNVWLEQEHRRQRAGLRVVRAHLDEIVSGHDFLRRTAARIAAFHGAWPVLQRIAAGSMA